MSKYIHFYVWKWKWSLQCAKRRKWWRKCSKNRVLFANLVGNDNCSFPGGSMALLCVSIRKRNSFLIFRRCTSSNYNHVYNWQASLAVYEAHSGRRIEWARRYNSFHFIGDKGLETWWIAQRSEVDGRDRSGDIVSERVYTVFWIGRTTMRELNTVGEEYVTYLNDSISIPVMAMWVWLERK